MRIRILNYIVSLQIERVKPSLEDTLPLIKEKRTSSELRSNLINGKDFEFIAGFKCKNGSRGEIVAKTEYTIV